MVIRLLAAILVGLFLASPSQAILRGSGGSPPVNLLTNGDFTAWTGDNPDNWTVAGETGTSYITESSGAVRFVYVAPEPTLSMTQSGVTTSGVVYNYSITIVSRVSGQIKIGGSFTSEATIPGATGTFTGSLTASPGGTVAIYRVGGSTTDLVFDNFSISVAP